MIEIAILRTLPPSDIVGIQPIHVTEQMFDRPYIVARAGPMAKESRVRIAIWANEGGAGGEVSR
jgi:hypothetical protein